MMINETKSFIREIVRTTKKPRLVCMCGNFEAGDGPKEYEYDFAKCQNCGGWMSVQAILENE